MRNFEKKVKSFSLKSSSNKSNLWWLYVLGEKSESLYHFEDLDFYFTGTSMRTIETAIMFIYIPASRLPEFDIVLVTAAEDFILRSLSPKINAMSNEWKNINKDAREKSEITAQETNAFCLRLIVRFPLTNGTWVNTKGCIKMIRALLLLVHTELGKLNGTAFKKQIKVYAKQQQIRRFLQEHKLCAFVADGSILPRENGTANPLKNALPFSSPDRLRVMIDFSDGSVLTGMAIKQGVTVITGGGYSGKSTLLDAIEMGIYNHIPGDGREFVITDESALKIYAEDGRPVHNLDISPFFQYLPNGIDITNFTSLHASGSVSQVANIIEAVYAGCKLLLIDEDRSATNFMIRDANIRKVVKREPIIPFTDRIRELYSEKSVSTVLVIGGSGEYLSYADTVILMEDYKASDITEDIKALELPKRSEQIPKAHWLAERYLIPKQTTQPFLFFRSVTSENQKKIILDDYSADITLLTSLVSDAQLNTLAFMMEQLLTDKEADHGTLPNIAGEIADTLYEVNIEELTLPNSFNAERSFEAIRPIDIFCCVSRMRGLQFKNRKE
jgi:hypothetical protein